MTDHIYSSNSCELQYSRKNSVSDDLGQTKLQVDKVNIRGLVCHTTAHPIYIHYITIWIVTFNGI